MAVYGPLQLTTQGQALYTKAQTGTTLTFTRMQIGGGQLQSGQDPTALKALISPVAYFNINTEKANGNTVTITGIFENTNLTAATYVCEIGLFAQDPTAGEILYAYANAGTQGDTLPPLSDGPISRQFNLSVTVSNATNVTVNIPANTYIAQSSLGVANGVATLDNNGLVPVTQIPSLSYIPTSAEGAANGVATLDSSGKVPTSQIHSILDQTNNFTATQQFTSPTASIEANQIILGTSSNVSQPTSPVYLASANARGVGWDQYGNILPIAPFSITSGNAWNILDKNGNKILSGYLDGTEKVTTANNALDDGKGNVGLGTTAPAYGLHQLGGAARIQALTTPSAPSVSAVGSPGGTSYTYYIVATDRNGNKTLASTGTTITTGNATLSTTNYNTISWAAVPGAVSYDVLKGSTGTSLATGVIGTSMNDTGQATTVYTAPTRNSTADFIVDGKILAYESNGTGMSGFSFYQDGGQDTGMFSSADGDLQFYSNNTKVLDVTNTGGVTVLGGVKTTLSNDGNSISLAFPGADSIYFDKYGNIRTPSYQTGDPTWGVYDSNGNTRFYAGLINDNTETVVNGVGAAVAILNNNQYVTEWYIPDANNIVSKWGGGKAIFKLNIPNNRFEVRDGADANWMAMAGLSFTAMSQRKLKKHIDSYEENALEKIVNTPIRTYRFKNEADDIKKHVGVITDEAPKDILDPLESGVDAYAMSAVAWKAIQELTAKVQELESKLAELEGKR